MTTSSPPSTDCWKPTICSARSERPWCSTRPRTYWRWGAAIVRAMRTRPDFLFMLGRLLPRRGRLHLVLQLGARRTRRRAGRRVTAFAPISRSGCRGPHSASRRSVPRECTGERMSRNYRGVRPGVRHVASGSSTGLQTVRRTAGSRGSRLRRRSRAQHRRPRVRRPPSDAGSEPDIRVTINRAVHRLPFMTIRAGPTPTQVIKTAVANLWLGSSTDLDQMAVGIADVAADLGLVLLRRGQELGAPRAPLGVHSLDVGNPDVEEAAHRSGSAASRA